MALNYDSILKFCLDTVCLNFSAFLITFDRVVKLHFTLGIFLVSLVQEAAFEIYGISSTLSILYLCCVYSYHH